MIVLLEKKAIRAKDIASRLSVKQSSVTSALQALSAKGYINYAPYDVITLTEVGEGIARKLFHKHQTLTVFFRDTLQLDADAAEGYACKMEHSVPMDVVDRIDCLTHFLKERDIRIDYR